MVFFGICWDIVLLRTLWAYEPKQLLVSISVNSGRVFSSISKNNCFFSESMSFLDCFRMVVRKKLGRAFSFTRKRSPWWFKMAVKTVPTVSKKNAKPWSILTMECQNKLNSLLIRFLGKNQVTFTVRCMVNFMLFSSVISTPCCMYTHNVRRRNLKIYLHSIG